jgi:hypothetical protein
MLLRRELIQRLFRLFLLLLVILAVAPPLLDVLAGNGIQDGYTALVLQALLTALGKM